MEAKLSIRYDREADILYITTCEPYADQESEELDDEIVARLNPRTGDVEGLEVLFFSARIERDDRFDLPISAELKLAEPGA
jgi:uncharacterized protein YuzE